MGRDRGWVTVSVQTYQSHRSSPQRTVEQEYIVEEHGATLNAVARSGEPSDEEKAAAQGSSSTAATSIFIRDWKLSGRRAYIQFSRADSSFWFNPVMGDNKHSSSSPGFPCSRGDIFLKLGMRGSRVIPWQLKEGDVFRLGQAYVLVSKVRLAADVVLDVSALSPLNEECTSEAGSGISEEHAAGAPNLRSSSGEEQGSDSDGEGNGEKQDLESRPQCYICYENGRKMDPLINPCQCSGSVKYVHLNCLQRWIQPEGSTAVNTHCPVCKARYPEKTQVMMIRPPAVLLESWSNHRSLKLRHWVSFAQHDQASLGRFADHNDVVIPDHSVSGEHAFLEHSADTFTLRDRESSNGSYIRLCEPLKLNFGDSLQLKMGKSLLRVQAKRSRWSRLRMRLNLLRSGNERSDEGEVGVRANCSANDASERESPQPPLRVRTVGTDSGAAEGTALEVPPQ